MNSLPIVERELRIAARSRWTFRVRTLFAVAGLLSCALVLGFANVSMARQGLTLLGVLSTLTLVFCLLAGCFLTADCLSSEKREGTLGLLFLTPLRSVDVVFGKLAANGLRGILGFLALLPVFFLPVLAGGVTWSETLRIWLTLCLSLAWSLSLGLLMSAWFTDGRATVMGTFAIVMSVTFLPLLYVLSRVIVLRQPFTLSGLDLLSPASLLNLAFEGAYQHRPTSFWSSAALLAALWIGTTLLACRSLARGWRELDGTSPKTKKPTGKSANPAAIEPSPPRVGRLPPFFGGIHPYESRIRRLSNPPRWFRFLEALLLVVLACLLAGAAFAPRGRCEPSLVAAMITAFALHLTLKIWVILELTRQVHEDQASGAFELMLIAPGAEARLLAGILAGSRSIARGPFRRLLAVNLALAAVVTVFAKNLHINATAWPVFIAFIAGGLVATLADLHAILWVAVWRAVTRHSYLQACLRVLATVLVPGWAGWGVLVAVLSGAQPREFELTLTLWACYLALVVYDQVLIGAARAQLGRGLRRILAESKEPSAPHSPLGIRP